MRQLSVAIVFNGKRGKVLLTSEKGKIADARISMKDNVIKTTVPKLAKSKTLTEQEASYLNELIRSAHELIEIMEE